MLPSSIETPRLLLRQPTLADAEAVLEEYSGDPEITRYLAWRPHRSLVEAQSYLTERIDEWRLNTRWTYALTLRAAVERMIGHIRLSPTGDGVRFGFVLAARYSGQGLMTEAVSALIPVVEATSSRLWAYCDAENAASMRVLEKSGFQQERLERGWAVFPNISDQPRDCVILARYRAPCNQPAPIAASHSRYLRGRRNYHGDE
jgi:RimJ/RimL family protein N-acetyltransferase